VAAEHVRLTGVSKMFMTGEPPAPLHAVGPIDLDLRRGEFFAVVGPSGCGKSTLLRLVAGLVAPTGGMVSISGARVTEPRDDTGIVFQAPTLLPWASVLDNVLFPLDMMRRLDAAGRERARDLLALVGLAGFEGKYPRELSGGMQQRAGICRALVHDPEILLMDEPFGALDAQTREQLQEDFLKIWSKTRATVIFVTHSIDEALLLSDRIFVFSTGPGRLQTIVDSPLAPERVHSDIRKHPAFAVCRAELRQMLRSEGP